MFASEASQPTDSRRGIKGTSSRKHEEAVMTERQDYKEYDNKNNAALTNYIIGEDDDEEFEWQRTGTEGKPPSRKRMLCLTLRRLFRIRM